MKNKKVINAGVINRNDAELIKCTAEQNSILNALSNIQLINGNNHIYTSETFKPILKLKYINWKNVKDFKNINEEGKK